MPSAGESKSPKASLVAAIDLTQKSINLDDSLADSHALLGYLYTLTRQHDKAIAQGERAVELEPNSSLSYLWLGSSLNYYIFAHLALVLSYILGSRDEEGRSAATELLSPFRAILWAFLNARLNI
jgi:tetratricopeptide (TPR) repeat protein